jgi:hypothetical protein
VELIAVASGDVKTGQPLWKTAQRLIKQLKIKLPCSPGIPLLCIYLKEMISAC